MKLTAILLLAAALHVSASGNAQNISLSGKNLSLEKVFTEIRRQTGYEFLYNTTLLQKAKPVDINVHDIPLQQVLDICFKDQPLTYEIIEKTIVVRALAQVSGLVPNVETKQAPLSQVSGLVTITGRIINEAGEPVIATVTVKGTTNATSTNNNGEYTLTNVDEKATLVITGVGIETQEIKVSLFKKGAQGDLVAINITAKIKVKEEETVVVAYNTITKKSNTGAVTVVKGEQIASFPNRSLDRSLQGLIPGLQITTGNGQPGGNVSNITLRGVGTSGAPGSTDNYRNPLFVIDGTVLIQQQFNSIGGGNAINPGNPLAQINPNDIESISILKDAAAIALYGSRASNGVVLITTKKGKAGNIKISFRHQTDIASRLNDKREVLNQDQYLSLLYESYKNANPATWTDQAIRNDLKNKFPYQVSSSGDTSFYQASNWFDELYSNSAVSVANDLSFSGGTDKTTYYLNLDYLNQDGILKHTGYDRGSLRYNMTLRPSSWINFGVNTSLSYNKQDFTPNFEGLTNINGFSYYVSPLLPIRSANGDYILYYPTGAGGSTVTNPIATMQYNINRATSYRGLGNIYGELSFLKHFTFTSNLAADLMITDTKRKVDLRLAGSIVPGPTSGSVDEGILTRSVIVATNTLRFNQTFHKKHSINILISQEAQNIQSNFVSGTGTGYSSYYFTQVDNGATRTGSGSFTKETLLSYFAQGNYSYKNKYFTSASVRLDGSSKFGDNVPFATFYSFGAGWLISDESFIKKTVNWLDYLKLRSSIGIAGNSNTIPQSTKYSVVTPANYVGYGSAVLFFVGNPDIKPEKTFSTDLGLEARVLKDRISITTDIYKRKTSDLIIQIPAPFTSGSATVITNIGDMENKGIELSLSADLIRNKNFKWNIGGNWSANKNKLVKSNIPQASAVGNLANFVGENYNSWYLVRWAGVDPQDGKPQWLDLAGNITKTFTNVNRVLAGKPQPDGFGTLSTGVTYNNFELSAFFYYSYGFKVLNGWLVSMINDGRSLPYQNQSTLALDRWQKPGDIATNPRRVLNNLDGGDNISTRYLVDGDYISFKNLLLSYNLSSNLIQRLRVNSVKIFIQANNLALWTKSSALNPDNTGAYSENAAAYPQQKSFSFGLNVNF